MRNSAGVVCAVMFAAPFLLLAGAYHTLPPELPVFRIPFGGAAIVAPKSAFMVFRVPLMNLTHGMMAAVLLTHTADFKDVRRRASYFAFFSTLLFAIALKSNFEALEISRLALALGPIGHWAGAGTIASVVGGLILAFVRGQGVPLPWPELRMPLRDKIALVGLLGVYVAILTVSLLVAREG
jgi:hypothetical protein